MNYREAINILMLSPLYFRLNPTQRLQLIGEYCCTVNSVIDSSTFTAGENTSSSDCCAWLPPEAPMSSSVNYGSDETTAARIQKLDSENNYRQSHSTQQQDHVPYRYGNITDASFSSENEDVADTSWGFGKVCAGNKCVQTVYNGMRLCVYQIGRGGESKPCVCLAVNE